VPQATAPQPTAAPAPQGSAASAPAAPAAARPAGTPARAAAPAPLSAAPQAQASAEDAATWQKVIDTFRSQHKQSTLACITQGRIRGFTGGQCFLEFPTETLAQLTLRIYKKQVEEVLASVFGHPMQLVCSAAEAAAPAPPPPPPKKRERPALPPLPHEEKPVEVDISALPADEQKSLQNAVSILGDNFIEPPEMPTQTATQAAPQEPSSAPPEQEPQQPQKQPPQKQPPQEPPHD
ncbi:MAG: DNA polymerase III subunit gamma/tau, partial [Selenomonadaceae bacterium]|nr:DNA polymerase III subunit gamma/tau [Selenomonadaceae bacterium]